MKAKRVSEIQHSSNDHVKTFRKMKLSELHKGESAVIDSFTNDDMKLKLMEMGCLPGERIKVSRHAPLGCPVAIKVANYTLSLRMEEADTIIVTKEV